jgi:hypothetical protein
MKSTHTNNQIHYSPVGRVSITCGSTYTIGAVNTVTNPLYVAHNSGDSTGMPIPHFQSSQQTGCPVNLREVSYSNVYMKPSNDLNNPVLINSNWVVKPTDLNRHGLYLFYIKATALGGSHAYFGGFQMIVGCTEHSLVTTDSPSFITNVPLNVGDNSTGVYYFHPPSSSKSYCTIKSNQIVT